MCSDPCESAGRHPIWYWCSSARVAGSGGAADVQATKSVSAVNSAALEMKCCPGWLIVFWFHCQSAFALKIRFYPRPLKPTLLARSTKRVGRYHLLLHHDGTLHAGMDAAEVLERTGLGEGECEAIVSVERRRLD